MNRIPIVLLCLTLALLLSSVGCSDDEDTSPSDEGLSVTVGALLPSTGALASYGEMSDAALEEAVAALEADGTSVDLLVEDTGTDPAAALEGLRSLLEEGVKLVIGPYASSEVREVKQFADENGIILISPLSTSKALSIPDDNVFRFTPDDEQEGIAVANLAYADGIRTIVPITRDDEGNKGLQSSMKPVFEALGGTVAPLITYSTEEEAFSEQVQQLVTAVGEASASGGPVAVYLTAFAEVTDLFAAATGSTELESVQWYGSDSVALSADLVEDETAAAFAVKADYPKPDPRPARCRPRTVGTGKQSPEREAWPHAGRIRVGRLRCAGRRGRGADGCRRRRRRVGARRGGGRSRSRPHGPDWPDGA